MDHEVLSPEQAANFAAWWGKAFEALREQEAADTRLPAGPSVC
jgi:hypothetical protein